MVLFIIFTMAGIKKLEQDVTYEYLTVAEGDTLWGYSEKYAENIPTDKWINEIVKINNLSSTTIKVGEKIRVPATPQEFKLNDIATNTLEDGK